MIRIVSVKSEHRTVIKIALYPDLLETLKTQEGMSIEQAVNKEIELSVEDVCQIAKALLHKKAISQDLKPTPSLQREHKFLTS